MPYFGTTKKGLTSRDGLWLAVAVLLHAALLLIPLNPEPAQAPIPDHPLLIELQHEELAEQPFVQQKPTPEPDPFVQEPMEPEEPEVLPEPLPEPLTEFAELDEPPPAEAQPDFDMEPGLTTAILLQAATDKDWPLATEKPARKLGVFVPPAPPENWRSGITIEDNMFNGMTVPRQVEIVDRWMAADGSHNVVINTPTGHTMCGRGLAWNPMQPLVEHVMQFRPCGGGGKRTFEMPHRYRQNSEPGGIANSTTN